MKSDIEISRECRLLDIKKVAKKINISSRYLECYGKNKAKINLDIRKRLKDKENGKLIKILG